MNWDKFFDRLETAAWVSFIILSVVAIVVVIIEIAKQIVI